MFAIAGGVFITLGTLATQYGWAYVGLTVTEVMASSLKVVIGSTLIALLLSKDGFLMLQPFQHDFLKS
jgi:hypothetical protein